MVNASVKDILSFLKELRVNDPFLISQNIRNLNSNGILILLIVRFLYTYSSVS